jgi:NitT/TauT family transport system ATP-binding protein
MSAPVVTVEGVSKTFDASGDRVVALSDIDLHVGEGEFVSLLGPSGCGKSTLLNLIGGLLGPTEGTLTVSGHEVTGPPPEIGMMFQRPTLLDWRTARQNVLLPVEATSGRKAAKAARHRADELLAMVGLEGFEGRYPYELSGGMQQRVAICRMLIAEPEVLLLDEPFGALDELTRERMNVELARIVAEQRRAALLVTHNVAEATFLADRVVVMSARPGRIAGIVDVDLERPRQLKLLRDDRFLRLEQEVRAILEIGYEQEVA